LRQFDDFLPFRSAAIVFAHLLILTPGHCQEVSQNPARGAFEKLLVKDATPIKLKLKRGVYSQYAQVGDVVEYNDCAPT
jgi:hypothetical protein